jgi:hypothetical protein
MLSLPIVVIFQFSGGHSMTHLHSLVHFLIDFDLCLIHRLLFIIRPRAELANSKTVIDLLLSAHL